MKRKKLWRLPLATLCQGPPLKGGAVSHQVVFDGVAGGSGSRGDPQLAVDRAHMEIDGGHADDELLSYLGAGQAVCEQTQHVPLTRRQSFKRGVYGRYAGRLHFWRLGKRHLVSCSQGLFWRQRSSLLPQPGQGWLSAEPLEDRQGVQLCRGIPIGERQRLLIGAADPCP